MMNKKVNDEIATLEDKINDVEFKLNEIMEENNLLKKMIDSKSGEFDRTTKFKKLSEKRRMNICVMSVILLENPNQD